MNRLLIPVAAPTKPTDLTVNPTHAERIQRLPQRLPNHLETIIFP